MTQLARNPIEGGSVIIRVSFKDHTGTIYEPLEDSVFYTLYAQRKEKGTWEIVNARQDVPIESQSVLDIVLQGEDLSLLPDCTTKRRLLIDWKYLRNGEETLCREMADFEVTPLPVLA